MESSIRHEKKFYFGGMICEIRLYPDQETLITRAKKQFSQKVMLTKCGMLSGT